MSAQLGNCPKCGKLYLRVRDICDTCYQKQEDDYLKAAAYLREYPGSTIQEVSDATKVTFAQIRQFILAGRILTGYYQNLSYPCETCGTLISSGRTCANCIKTLNKLVQLDEDDKKETKSSEWKSRRTGYISH